MATAAVAGHAVTPGPAPPPAQPCHNRRTRSPWALVARRGCASEPTGNLLCCLLLQDRKRELIHLIHRNRELGNIRICVPIKRTRQKNLRKIIK